MSTERTRVLWASRADWARENGEVVRCLRFELEHYDGNGVPVSRSSLDATECSRLEGWPVRVALCAGAGYAPIVAATTDDNAYAYGLMLPPVRDRAPFEVVASLVVTL